MLDRFWLRIVSKAYENCIIGHIFGCGVNPESVQANNRRNDCYASDHKNAEKRNCCTELAHAFAPVFLYSHRFLRCRFNWPNARSGMIKIIASVRMLIEAAEKYVAGKLLQPWGKVGDHA
jgi:hypothetical protein